MLSSRGRQNNAPPPDAQNLSIRQVTWQRGIYGSGGTMVVNQLSLRQGGEPGSILVNGAFVAMRRDPC